MRRAVGKLVLEVLKKEARGRGGHPRNAPPGEREAGGRKVQGPRDSGQTTREKEDGRQTNDCDWCRKGQKDWTQKSCARRQSVLDRSGARHKNEGEGTPTILWGDQSEEGEKKDFGEGE
jgi:hypothetical protein